MSDSSNRGRPSGGRDERPRGTKAWSSRDDRGSRGPQSRGGRDSRDSRGYVEELTEEQKLARELRPVRARHDDPELPDDVDAKELDRIARNELKTLTKENAEAVARHLAMVARLIEDDPELAHRHATSASRRAGRISVVRETLAITAYAVGDYALALRELRTYRRISGSNEQLPLMVDSERGVGRPDKALELGRSVDRSTLTPATQALLAIAMSGARLDLDDAPAALRELEIPQLDPDRAYSYSPDLFHAYAEVLEELGRVDEAGTWRDRADRADRALAASAGDSMDETIEIYEEDTDVPDSNKSDGVLQQDIDDADETAVPDSDKSDGVIESVETRRQE